ncbi:COG4648 family protein [Natronospira bacteriovora]|uniref:DNA gyrase subunit B n=1 Tax=Natronospira bacteriovora TaxID=3069753 RepID=A0ABU0W7J0_9GAMM|nr:hypothetical protein [Natronospira sp. AB-CW4]MDQ2069993.1 hypothetical protein [Natronospira sp. AB-CW4]
MKALLPAISGIALAVYPLVVLLGMRYLELGVLWMLLLALIALRVLAARWFHGLGLSLQASILILLAALFTLPLLVDLDFMVGIRFYPVLANLGIFSLFFGSLFTRMPLAERFARLRDKELPPQAILYTRRLTWLWSLFLCLNTFVALGTALWASDVVWALYNGLVSYCLVGLLFTLEYFYRQRARRYWSAS